MSEQTTTTTTTTNARRPNSCNVDVDWFVSQHAKRLVGSFWSHNSCDVTQTMRMSEYEYNFKNILNSNMLINQEPMVWCGVVCFS